MRKALLTVAAATSGFLFACGGSPQGSDDLSTGRVVVDTGPLVGAIEGPLAQFFGIPFAAPPVGEQRFRPPAAPASWTEPRDAQEMGPGCLQAGVFSALLPVPNQSEDCLSLNVWAPTAATAEPRPVMVWAHGGGFTSGASSVYLYDGARLAEQGVVVVSFNYRLDRLGFLAHPALGADAESGTSGNYGLLDQIAALEWVQRNIAAFGGDPSNVTFFGQSAGGISGCALAASPLADGLFHKLIIESGGCLSSMRHLREDVGRWTSAESEGIADATSLGCDGPDAAACLRALPASAFIDELKTPDNLLPGPGSIFGLPVVDGYVLPEAPGARMNTPLGVPLLIGANENEGSLLPGELTEVKTSTGFAALVRERFNNPEAILAEYGTDDDRRVQGKIKRLLSNVFACHARLIAARAAAHGPAYLYHFARIPPTDGALLGGAYHGAEVAYVFGDPLEGDGYEAIDRTLSEQMMGDWVSFATRGAPSDAATRWPAYAPEQDRTYVYDESPGVRAHPHGYRCDLLSETEF